MAADSGKAPARSRVERGRTVSARLSLAWLLPLAAALFAGWVVWESYSKRGPLVEITFDTLNQTEDDGQITGTVSLNDPDTSDSPTLAGATGTGSFGNITVGQDGSFTYVITDASLQTRPVGDDAQETITLALHTPDFTTAARVEDTINQALGQPAAYMRDPGSIELRLSGNSGSPARVLAAIENLPIKVETPARIVIDEKSGTIVLGQDVTISQVAIAQGNISIKVRENPVVVQPNPFAAGETICFQGTGDRH